MPVPPVRWISIASWRPAIWIQPGTSSKLKSGGNSAAFDSLSLSTVSKMNIKLKRAHEDADPGDGIPILVERLRPRGVTKRATGGGGGNGIRVPPFQGSGGVATEEASGAEQLHT